MIQHGPHAAIGRMRVARAHGDLAPAAGAGAVEAEDGAEGAEARGVAADGEEQALGHGAGARRTPPARQTPVGGGEEGG